MSTVLVTGASGYVGQELAARLLAETGHDVLLWLHASSIEEAEAKAAPLRRRFAADERRLRFAHGELAAANPFAEVETSAIHAVVHSAAVTRFNVDAATAQAVNVEGAEKVFAFARSCPRLERLVQVSTVYASGLAEGVVDERAPFPAPAFANHYERSKHEAEALLLERYGDVPACIARVATVLADDDSGRVTQQNAVHNTLKLFFYGLLSLVPGKKATPLYFVTGAFVADALLRLTERGAPGCVYHVAHPRDRALDLSTLVDEAFRTFGEDASFKQRRVLPPLYADADSFEVLVSGIDGFGGDVLRQALGSVAPFARQLFVDKDVRTDRLEELLPTAGPDARELRPGHLRLARADALGEGVVRAPFSEWASAALERPVVFAAAMTPLPETALTAQEREAEAALQGDVRRREWRRGRAAVREVLARAPGAPVSVSHGRGFSVALAALGAFSVGIDVEGPRAPAAAAARFFLTDAERTAVHGGAPEAETLLRLFSTKEALLKAAGGKDGLRDYVLDDPRAAVGTARTARGARFRYAAFSAGKLVVSVAATVAPSHQKESEA